LERENINKTTKSPLRIRPVALIVGLILQNKKKYTKGEN